MLYILIFLLLALGLGGCALSLWGWGVLAAALLTLGVYLLLHLLFFILCWLLSLPVDRSKPIERQNPRSRAACAIIAQILCCYGGVRAELIGLEKLPEQGRFLLVSNHRSLFDPIVAIAKLRRYNISFISKLSNMAIPMGGDIAYAAGYLGIDREDDRKALRTILTAADYMRRGVCSMAIYPEGTRSRDGHLLPFHAGSFKAAQRANVPVVVLCAEGTEKVMKRLFRRPTRVKLTVLEVIPAEDARAMHTSELAEHCRSLIARYLGEETEAQP